MGSYQDIWYESGDGLRLHARDYGGKDAALTVLCLPGLTRNASDFEGLCTALSDTYRVIAAELRGRGDSDRDTDPSHYEPVTYVQDMFTLIETLQLGDLALVGTSLGGLMSMMMNAMQPGRYRGVVLNDIGPEVNPAGLERIKGYVGKGEPPQSWDEAVTQVKETNKIAFPKFTDEDWVRFARRMFRENEAGIPVSLYDPAISSPIDEADENAVPPDLWPVFDTLANVPLLVIRGELTDILHADCVREMQRRKPDMQLLEVPDVGHAPTLDEDGVAAKIREFLQNI